MDQASIEALRQAVDVSRSRIAALCFLVWDVFITTDQEVEHIWLTPFQPLKLLYLFTRYYSVIVLIVLNVGVLSCHGWIVVEAVSAVLLEISIEILLMLRIYAIYTGNKLTIKALLPAFVAQVTIMIVSLGISLPRIMTSPHCVEADFPVTIIAYSITSIVFESFLFGLAMFRYWTAHSQGWQQVTLFQLLIRDNMWTFLIIFVANLTNTVLFTLAPTTFANMGFPFLLAIFGSIGPRLVLNVRQAHAKKTNVGAGSSSSLSISLPLVAYAPVAVYDPDTPQPSTAGSGGMLYSPLRAV